MPEHFSANVLDHHAKTSGSQQFPLGTGKFAPKTSYVVPLKSGNKPPLFCIHCATGDILRYRDLVAHLASDQPVYGLRAPQIDKTKTLPTVEELAALYVADIREIQSRGPYQLCGLSVGGMLAFEAASQLRAQDEEVSLLALFDTGNPAYYRDMPLGKWIHFRTIYLVTRFQKYARRITNFEIRGFYSDLRKFVSWNFRKLQWLVGGREALIQKRDSEKIYDENIVMFASIGSRYTPKPYTAHLNLFRAEGRPQEHRLNFSLGWDEIVQGGIDVQNVPGIHETLLDEPFVHVLAERLQSCLNSAVQNKQE